MLKETIPLKTVLATLVVATLAFVGCASGGVSPEDPANANSSNATPNAAFNNTTPVNNGGGMCPTNSCAIGQAICTAADIVQVCTVDVDGCGRFELAETCVGGQLCQDGRCAEGCVDNDGDGHGTGCANGGDCDDTDFDKHKDKMELCDNKDNDCDTQIDEGDACGAGCANQECTPGAIECVSGTSIRECRADNNGCGSWGPESPCGEGGTCTDGACSNCVDNDGDQRGAGCVFGDDCLDTDPTIYPDAPELCDNKDNNCNDEADEGDVCAADCANQECAPGATECASGTETRRCGANAFGCGVWGGNIDCGGACTGGQCAGCTDGDGDGQGVGCALGADCNDSDDTIYDGAPELCDGKDNDCKDNDCNDDIDEDFTDLGDSCSAGLGVCARTGSRECSASGTSTICNAIPGGPESNEDICGDGEDNDCDGNMDEGFEAVGQGCTDGVGACQRSGVFECAAGGASVECSAVAGNPSTEVCNGEDDNCNMQTDEGGVCGGMGCQEDGNEENDSSGSAASLPRGTSTSGVICGGNGTDDTLDQDWYDLGSYNAGQTITVNFSFSGPGATLHLEVYRGSTFVASTPPGGSPQTLNFNADATGTFKLWVYPNTNLPDGVSYTLDHQ